MHIILSSSLVFSLVKRGLLRTMETNFLARPCFDRTKGNIFKLIESKLRLDTRKKFFYKHGETLEQVSREVVDAPFLEKFKIRLDGPLGNLSS